jgi:A/G-specific adenine glycosylase
MVGKTYEEIIKEYPDIYTLSTANLDDIFHWFKPLGLFSRANLLISLAKTIVEKYNCMVPNNLDDLLALPGLGKYSARAVLCLGFGAPYPMVDEGGGRVLRRVLGLSSNLSASSDKNLFQIAEKLLPLESSREFNLGLLDLAARICHPHNPNCRFCPLRRICCFVSNGLNMLPKKTQ